MDIQNMTFPFLVSFGGVWLINYLLDRYFHRPLETMEKLILMAVLAFGLGFVPVDLGNDLATRIKDAISLALAGTGGYQGAKNVMRASA